MDLGLTGKNADVTSRPQVDGMVAQARRAVR